MNIETPGSSPVKTHECRHVGLTHGAVKFEQAPNHGHPCWVAKISIDSMLGAEVDGQVVGIGPTREIAELRAMNKLAETSEILFS